MYIDTDGERDHWERQEKKSNRGKHVARFEKWKKDTDKTLDSTNMEDSI